MKRIIIADCRADEITIKSLQKTGYTVIPTVKLECVYDAIASHADIQIHYLGNNCFVCAPESFEHYKKYMTDDYTLIRGGTNLGDKYPADIAYNAAALKNTLICNSRHTAPEILDKYCRVLNVAQGYSKCSICVVDGNAIITADTGIATAARRNGIDVLKITEGHIVLKNMNYGFIGGASGLIESNLLAFNGELKKHPDGVAIKQFCKKHGTEILELKSDVLNDIGSIISNIDFK